MGGAESEKRISESSSSGKRSRFDEVGGELGRDSRNGGYERSERSESRNFRERGGSVSNERVGRDSRDSSDYRYRERESSRDLSDPKEITKEYKDQHRSRDHSTRDEEEYTSNGSGSKRVRDDRDYDSHRSRYRDDRGYRGEDRAERDREYRSSSRSRTDERSHRSNERSYRGNGQYRANDQYRGNDYQRNDQRRNNNVEIPFDKFLKLSPWRGPVTPLEERVKHLKNWDVAPAGFERISADKAKMTGLFPPPGNITKTSNYVPPTLDPARAAMFQMLNRDVNSNNISSTIDTSSLPANLAKQAKRVYLGNLPYDFNESDLMAFLETNLRGLSGRSGDSCVLSINVSTDRTYAFVECKTGEDATMAMSLDGVIYEGSQLKVRRPKEYHMAVTSGQIANVSSNTNNTGSNIVNTIATTTSAECDKRQMIISGIPDILTSDHVKSLLLLVTDLRSFLLLKDGETGKSLGVAIFEFIEDLGGEEWSGPFLKHSKGSLFVGPFEMKIQRIESLMKFDEADVDAENSSKSDTKNMINLLSVYNLLPGHATALTSTSVLQLLNIVSKESLSNEEEFDLIFKDLKQELEKYCNDPNELELIVPKPGKDDKNIIVPGIGKVFAKFGNVESAARAASELAGRIFDGHTCIVSFYPEDKFEKNLF